MERGIYDIVVPGEPVEIADPIQVQQSGTFTIEPVNIASKTLLFATGTAAVNGNNTLISAPGSGQIKIAAIQIQNESTVSTLAILNFGATPKWRLLAKEQGVGFILPIPPGHVWGVGAGNALVLTLNGANQFGYNVAYYVE